MLAKTRDKHIQLFNMTMMRSDKNRDKSDDDDPGEVRPSELNSLALLNTQWSRLGGCSRVGKRMDGVGEWTLSGRVVALITYWISTDCKGIRKDLTGQLIKGG